MYEDEGCRWRSSFLEEVGDHDDSCVDDGRSSRNHGGSCVNNVGSPDNDRGSSGHNFGCPCNHCGSRLNNLGSRDHSCCSPIYHGYRSGHNHLLCYSRFGRQRF